MEHTDVDSVKRQTGINTWYYKYQLEMLFIMQLAFIGLSSLLLISVLSSYGLIPGVFVMYYGVLMVFIVCAVWYFKGEYTIKTRDHYHWDRRRFSADLTTQSPFNSNVKAAITDQLAAHCAKQQ
jgi:hypothetical protein